MELTITPVEARVLGCLVEKELATPEYYPLTLNALVNACNQKSNRDPVMILDEEEVLRALDSLRFQRLARQSAEGVRAARYCHNLDSLLQLEPQELAILAELLLRGPQTAGELRGRAERMAPLADLAAVESAIAALVEREAPLAVRLPRQPGRKEQRFAHLLSGPPVLNDDAPGSEQPRPLMSAEQQRLDGFAAELAGLRAEVAALREELQGFRRQFE